MITKVEITETKPSKFIDHKDGCEVISNDGEMRILLKKINIYAGNMEQYFYSTTYFIKEGNGWIQANESTSYNSKKDFVDAISKTEEFTQAMDDYKALYE